MCSRGFGVHSPSAYKLIREVLCLSSDYGFYAYDALEALEPRGDCADLKLLYRLMVHFRPESVRVEEDGSRLVSTVRMALSKVKVVDKGAAASFVVVDGNDMPEFEYCDCLLWLNSSLTQAAQMARRIDCGHVFASPRRTLLVRRHDLTPQMFVLDF